MMNKNDGGPAFPLGQTQEEWMNGMTLRGYFAAKAMQALLTSETALSYSDVAVETLDIRRDQWVAQQAVSFADALIVELAK